LKKVRYKFVTENFEQGFRMSYLFREEVLNNEQLPSCFLQPFLVCLTLALHTPLNGKNFSHGDAQQLVEVGLGKY